MIRARIAGARVCLPDPGAGPNVNRQAAQRGTDRRGFLKQSGGALLTLSLLHLVPAAAKRSFAAPRAQAVEIARARGKGEIPG